MIPLRLTLQNFMCYREETAPLELEDVRLACLSGENGAGKSAILDAITWALWGKARVNADLDLMSIGATEMRVEFEFRLGDLDYRVARRRTRRGAAAGWLDFYVLDRETGAWRSLSGDGVRETQRIIIETLRMEYDTFINSAFLLQGRADEFTTKPPAKRKEVLGEILGLSVYDELEDKARAALRERAQQLLELDGECQRLQQAADEAPVHEAELERLSTTLMGCDEEIEQLTAAHRTLHAELLRLEQEERRVQALCEQAREDLRRQRQEEEWAAACRRDVEQHEALLARRAEIEAGAARLAAARQQRQVFDQALREVRQLEGERHRLEREIEGERRKLLADQRHYTEQLAKLDSQIRELPRLEAQRQQIAQQASQSAALTETIQQRRARERAVHGEVEALKASNNALKQEMHRLKDHQKLVDAADAGCPLCRRPLGMDEKAHIHAEYQAEGGRLVSEYRANEQRTAALRAEGQQLTEALTELELCLQRAQLAAREEATLRQRIEQVEQARAEYAELHLRLIALTERIEQGDFAREARTALVEIVQRIEALGYAEAAHDAARTEEVALEHFGQDQIAMLQAAEKLPQERDRLRVHEQTARALAERVAQAQAEATALDEQMAALDRLRSEEGALVRTLEERGRQRDLVRLDMGRVEQRIISCQQAAEALATRTAERRIVAEERELYQALAEAFGKKGIQAMIIEQIVPEIQDEANRLLDQMPGNTMRVEFQTQRDSQRGDTIETLDVIIKDEVGARKYELYSGGEAFRANFAIRVALSKLLARRAGARLQMLVIDEGFGTQDARGREGLVQAIQSVERDFETILVITHLGDIKDEFSTRIEITKGLDGSRIAVV